MKDTRQLINRVMDSGSTLAEKHEAFGELVSRYQDMAFACAYAVLGDFYLAEDVAQESFITAWLKLCQLREPDAFAGWLKRIVLTQCNRMTRGKRLTFVPLDAGLDVASRDTNQQAAAETSELKERVLALVRSLPEGERMVTTLFYVDGYTQADIGEFLELPVTTVVKRLYSARQRLKGGMSEMFKDNLRKKRPSRDKAFTDRVGAQLRPFREQDWEPVTALAKAQHPRDEEGHDLWLRGRKIFDEGHYIRRHYIAEHAETGQLVGYGCAEQSIYRPKYRLFLVADPVRLCGGVGDLLLDRLMNDVREVNAITVMVRDYAARADFITFLEEHEFVETGREWDMRLSLEKFELSTLAPVIERVAAQGISIRTLAEEQRSGDTDCIEKLCLFVNTLKTDDPTRPTLKPPAYNAREALIWFSKPYVLPEAYFIAKRGGEYVGVTYLNLLETVPGAMTQGFTGVIRELRRQGVATALKARAFEHAHREGYRTIRAFNRPEHTALIALNEKLGFRRRTSFVTMEKCLRDVVKVDSSVYDACAGQYRDEEHRPDLIITVTNEGEHLMAEFVGQKVELFPESETTFFVKQFYGQVTFTRDEKGEITHLVWRELNRAQSEHEIRAKKMK